MNEKIINKIYFSNDFYDNSDVRHYLDKMNLRDLILSCLKTNTVCIFDFKDWKKLLTIDNVNNSGVLYSSCFFNDNNKIYILTTNIEWHNNINNIKVYDLKGNKIKEINNSNKNVIYIDTYFDSKLNKILL